MSKIEKVISISLDDKTKTGLDKIEQTFKDVDSSIKKAEGTSANLRKELKQLQNDLLSGKFTGEEFKQAEQRAGELKDTISDLSAKIKVLGSDTRTLDGVISAAEGLAGGFAIAQGAAALFGDENKELEKALLKVQSAMAILNGIQAVANVLQKESAARVLASTIIERIRNFVKTGSVALNKQETASTVALTVATGAQTVATQGATLATKALRIALISTGIGAIVVGVMALVAAWNEYNDTAEESTETQKDLNDEIEEGIKANERYRLSTNELNDIVKLRTKIALEEARKRGASDKEMRDIEAAGIQEQINNITKIIQAQRYRTTITREERKALVEEQKGLQDELTLLIAKGETDDFLAKKAADKKREDERIKRFEKEKAETIKNGEDIQAALNRIAQKRLDEEQAYKDKAAAILKGVSESNETPAQKLEREYRENLAILEKAHANTLTLTAKFITDKKALEDAAAEETKRKQLSDEQAIADAKLAIQNSYLDSLAGLAGIVGALAGKNKDLQRIALIAESAAGIAKIIINTQAANSAAVLKYAPLPGGQALSAAEIVANKISAGIGIAANVVATSKALSAIGGGGGVSSSSVGGAAPQAQFNIVGQGPANRLSETVANREQQPLRAYVVGSDVTSQQSLDRNKINNSTFL